MNETIERVGIVGGGQLGRMLTVEAKRLGFEVEVVDPAENCPAAQVGAEQIQAALTDEDAIRELADRTDVLTWEIEHIPAEFLQGLAEEGYNIEPSPDTLVIIQDKLGQKNFLGSLGIRLASYGEVLSTDPLMGSGPFVVKSRKGGYDGRGNLVVDSLDDPRIQEKFGDQPVYVEKAVEFERELAVVAARSKMGEIAVYPLVETIHKDNICHTVIAPARVGEEVRQQAEDIAHETLEHLEGAGVFAIEMFDMGGSVLVNEIAPRVHNSGHLTDRTSETSQFEQHIRAITGMPLGSTRMISPAAVMINVLGTHEGPLDRTGLESALDLPNTYPQFYGKSLREARKVGHITVTSHTIESALEIAQQARDALSGI